MRWSRGAMGRVPRLAHRRVILFFWPTRASSANQISIVWQSWCYRLHGEPGLSVAPGLPPPVMDVIGRNRTGQAFEFVGRVCVRRQKTGDCLEARGLGFADCCRVSSLLPLRRAAARRFWAAL